LHAPVFMGRANAGDGTGSMLISRPKQHHEALLPILQKMTGKLVWLGEVPERAAAFNPGQGAGRASDGCEALQKLRQQCKEAN
jgi:hypothetical protein